MRTIYWVIVVGVLWAGVYMLFWREGSESLARDDVAPDQGVELMGVKLIDADLNGGSVSADDVAADDVVGDDVAADDVAADGSVVDDVAMSIETSELDSTDPTPLQGDPVPDGALDLRGAGDATVVEEPVLRDGVWHVSFDYLADYPFDEEKASAGRGKPSYKSQVPARIYELNGKIVSVEGYMIPLKGLGTRVFQFYLARHNGTCCFGQPLNINDVVEVFVQDDKGSPHFYGRVRAQGKFEVGEGYDEEGYLINVYRMRADVVEETEEL